MVSILRNRKSKGWNRNALSGSSDSNTSTSSSDPTTTASGGTGGIASTTTGSAITTGLNGQQMQKTTATTTTNTISESSMTTVREDDLPSETKLDNRLSPCRQPPVAVSTSSLLRMSIGSVTKLPWRNASTGELATEVTLIPKEVVASTNAASTVATTAASASTRTMAATAATTATTATTTAATTAATTAPPPFKDKAHHLLPHRQPILTQQSSCEMDFLPSPRTTAKSLLSSSTATAASSSPTMRLAMSGSQVARDEQRYKKIAVRILSGAFLIGIFVGCVFMGHLYVCMIVAFGQFLLFRELVKVRYHAHFATIQDTIPLFRTTQWMWFLVAIFYTYGDFIVEIIQNNQQLHYLLLYAQYATSIAFILYSATFVTTIATMQVGLIKFQLNQLCWTIVVLCLTVGQMKYIMHNIFNGLIWFVLPFLLVVTNDIMAYVFGVTCGRKFIQRPFITFSPNKTWEGFIGGAISTICVSWYLSRFLATNTNFNTWMTCPTNEFRLFPQALQCELHPIFHQAQSIFPPQMFELFPPSIVKLIPGIVEICSVKNTTTASSVLLSTPPPPLILEPCISGESTQLFHHFELVVKNVYPIQIHAFWLALFASLVAPFGGFLASAIKRAYGIKDFDSIIPGHGGVMDRMDCQFLMALCTWVHYNTFVKLATVSVPKLWYMYGLLSESEKLEFLSTILIQGRTEANSLYPGAGSFGAAGTSANSNTYATVEPATVHAVQQAAELAMKHAIATATATTTSTTIIDTMERLETST